MRYFPAGSFAFVMVDIVSRLSGGMSLHISSTQEPRITEMAIGQA
jgi:hypothetical protein